MNWLWRELAAPWQDPMAVINPLVFLLLSITLFALAVPEQALVEHGAAVLWVMGLLTNVLSLDGLFRRAFDNGTLEQVLLQAPVPALAVAGRLIVHWVYSGLLIALLSPLLGGLLGIPTSALGGVAGVLLVGSPALTLLGGMGAVAWVVGRQFLSDGVETLQDAAGVSGLPALGGIPRVGGLLAGSTVVADHIAKNPKSAVTETVRACLAEG